MVYRIDLESLIYITFYLQEREKIDAKEILDFGVLLEEKLRESDSSNNYYVDASKSGIQKFVNYYSSDFDLINRHKTVKLRSCVEKVKGYVDTVVQENIRNIIRELKENGKIY